MMVWDDDTDTRIDLTCCYGSLHDEMEARGIPLFESSSWSFLHRLQK